MENNEKVELLIAEKELVRKEILQNIKILFSSLYSFLGVFAVLLVFYYNKDNLGNTAAQSKVLFLMQQIEVVVLLFNIHLNSMIMTLAGYCAALEERINVLCGDKISIWESIIINRFAGKPFSIQSISVFILNVIYLGVILLLEKLIQDKELFLKKEYNMVYLITVSVEVFSLVSMCYFVYVSKEKAYLLAKKNLQSS